MSKQITSQRQKGFSLVEVMLAGAIMMGLGLGLFRFIQMQSNSGKQVIQSVEVMAIFNEMRGILSDSDSCTETLKTQGITPHYLVNKRFGSDQNKFHDITQATPFKSENVSIKSYAIKDLTVASGKREGSAKMAVTFIKKTPGHTSEITKTMDIFVNVSNPGSANLTDLESCGALSSGAGDGHWTAGEHGSIYYNGPIKSTTNLEDDSKCDANTEGAITYNSSNSGVKEKTIHYCNGNKWEKIHPQASKTDYTAFAVGYRDMVSRMTGLGMPLKYVVDGNFWAENVNLINTTTTQCGFHGGSTLSCAYPGDTIRLNLNYYKTQQESTYCPSCIVYVTFAWKIHDFEDDKSGRIACVSGGSRSTSNLSGTINNTFTIPADTRPGIIFITMKSSWVYNCGQAADGDPMGDVILGIINVQSKK